MKRLTFVFIALLFVVCVLSLVSSYARADIGDNPRNTRVFTDIPGETIEPIVCQGKYCPPPVTPFSPNGESRKGK